MKIGFDAKRAFSNYTGLGNYARDTIRILSHYAPNNNYVLFTPNKNNNIRTSFIHGKENILVKTPETLINKFFTKFWRTKNIVNDLHKNDIHIYHGLSNELPIGIEKTSIKTVVTIHDLIFIRHPHLFNTIDRKIYYKKFKHACTVANKIIAVSKQTKKDIVKYFNISPNKITVAYQGCNQVFQSKIPELQKQLVIKKHKIPKDYLLYVGTIEERKNLLTILKTIQELPKQKLVIIGDGKTYKIKCLQFIKKHKLSNRVVFLSKLSLEDMSAIYQAAKIMIYPSIFEGFGIPILEALFSKTPVITTNGGCFVEAGGENSKYIDPLSINDMKQAIIEIESSAETERKMKEEGFKYAQKFTDDKIAKKLIEIYNNL